MPVFTITTPGTRQALKTAADWIVNSCPRPSQRYCRSINFRLLTSGATIYIGRQEPDGVSNTVSSTVYDLILNDTTPAVPIGVGNENNSIDMGRIWLDTDTASAQFVYDVETV